VIPKGSKASRSRTSRTATPQEEHSASESEWSAQYIGGFDKSLQNLGIPQKQQILAQLQSFMEDIRQNKTTKELREAWDYKAIQGAQAKKYGVMQIKPLRNYRVLLTLVVDESERCIWFLEVHRRGSNDDEHRDSAIVRARTLHNQK